MEYTVNCWRLQKNRRTVIVLYYRIVFFGTNRIGVVSISRTSKILALVVKKKTIAEPVSGHN